MDQSDELSLWLAHGWLRASGDIVQGRVIEDLQAKVMQGTTLTEGLAAISSPQRYLGEFGMEMRGSLLAPVLVTLLKDFWSKYLMKLKKAREEY